METKKILFVEDSEDLSLMGSRVLKREGFEVLTAMSGREALQKLESFTPHLVLLDLTLPDMAADEFVTRMRTFLGDQAPTLALLSGRDEIGEWSRTLNARAFLKKPYLPKELSEMTKRLIGSGLRPPTETPSLPREI